MQLPAEVWGRVFSYCASAADLRSAARVSSIVGAEAERVLYEQLAFTDMLPILRLRLALKRSDPRRRDRRLAAVRYLVLRLGGLTPAYDVWPQTHGSLYFLCRKAMLRAVVRLIVACPLLVSLELHLPMLPGAPEPLDPRALLGAKFALVSLNLELPYTPALAALLAAHAGTLKNLRLVPQKRPAQPLAPPPQLPRLARLDTIADLAGLWPGVRSLRVHAQDADAAFALPHALPHLAHVAESLHVLRISALSGPATVSLVARVLPRLRGLTVDVAAPALTPWDDDAWAAAFCRMRALVNFRLRGPGPGRAHPWDAVKPAALHKWRVGCPSLRYVAFPGEDDRWSWDSQRGVWRAPAY